MRELRHYWLMIPLCAFSGALGLTGILAGLAGSDFWARTFIALAIIFLAAPVRYFFFPRTVRIQDAHAVANPPEPENFGLSTFDDGLDCAICGNPQAEIFCLTHKIWICSKDCLVRHARRGRQGRTCHFVLTPENVNVFALSTRE